MSKQEQPTAFIAKLKLRWYVVLRDILSLWVKPRAQADADGNIGALGDQPVCYVMDSYALSSVLILDKYCEKESLSRPLLPVPEVPENTSRSYAVLKRLKGIFFRRPVTRTAGRSGAGDSESGPPARVTR